MRRACGAAVACSTGPRRRNGCRAAVPLAATPAALNDTVGRRGPAPPRPPAPPPPCRCAAVRLVFPRRHDRVSRAVLAVLRQAAVVELHLRFHRAWRGGGMTREVQRRRAGGVW